MDWPVGPFGQMTEGPAVQRGKTLDFDSIYVKELMLNLDASESCNFLVLVPTEFSFLYNQGPF